MTDFIRAALSPPFTTTRGSEYQSLGGGSKAEGSFNAQIHGTDPQGTAPVDAHCDMTVDAQWGKHLWRPFKSVDVKDADATANMSVGFTRDDKGQGTLQVTSKAGDVSSEVDIPVGDIGKAGASFFEPGPTGTTTPPLRHVSFEQVGGRASVILNDGETPGFIIKDGNIGLK